MQMSSMYLRFVSLQNSDRDISELFDALKMMLNSPLKYAAAQVNAAGGFVDIASYF